MSTNGLLYYIDATGVEGPLLDPAKIAAAALKVQTVRNAGIESYNRNKVGARPHCCAIVRVENEDQLALYKHMMKVVGKVKFDQDRINQAIREGLVVKELELEEDLNAFTVYFLKNLWASPNDEQSDLSHPSGDFIFGRYLADNGMPHDEFFTKFEVSPVGQFAVKDRKDAQAKQQWKALYDVSHRKPLSVTPTEAVVLPTPIEAVVVSTPTEAVVVPTPTEAVIVSTPTEAVVLPHLADPANNNDDYKMEINIDNPFAISTGAVATTTHSGKQNYSLPVIRSDNITTQTLSCVSDKNSIKCQLSNSKTSFVLKHNVLGRVIHCYYSDVICVCWTDLNGAYEITTIDSQSQQTEQYTGIAKFAAWFHLVGLLTRHGGVVHVHDLHDRAREMIHFNESNSNLLAISPDCVCTGAFYHNNNEEKILAVETRDLIQQVTVRDNCNSPSFISSNGALHVPHVSSSCNAEQVFGKVDENTELWWWQLGDDECFAVNGGTAMLQCNNQTAKRVPTQRNAKIAHRIKPGEFLDDQLRPIAWDVAASTELAQIPV
jgi:hypothetical protein